MFSNNLEIMSWNLHQHLRRHSNELGLYDMSGNVWEWCWDRSDAASDYDNGPTTDPKGLSTGDYRVCRGGSFEDTETDCKIILTRPERSNHQGDANTIWPSCGFRVVKVSQ